MSGRRTDADGRGRWPSFTGRNVDLFTEALDVEPGGDLVTALRHRLAEPPTKKWRDLAAKAVVRIEPELIAELSPSSSPPPSDAAGEGRRPTG